MNVKVLTCNYKQPVRSREERGSFRASPSYVGGVLATSHDTEGH
jgi:hypothetical protein